MNNSNLIIDANPDLKTETRLVLHDNDQIERDEATNNDDCIRDSSNNNDNDTDTMECGIGSFRPACLQSCANMYYFVLVYSLAELATACLRVYISTQISALERQFEFSSAKSGFLLACNDIGFLTTVLFVSHYLRHSHAPRALSFLNFLYGLSGLICALPYFLGSETIHAHNKQYSETLISGGEYFLFNSSLVSSQLIFCFINTHAHIHSHTHTYTHTHTHTRARIHIYVSEK